MSQCPLVPMAGPRCQHHRASCPLQAGYCSQRGPSGSRGPRVGLTFSQGGMACVVSHVQGLNTAMLKGV